METHRPPQRACPGGHAAASEASGASSGAAVSGADASVADVSVAATSSGEASGAKASGADASTRTVSAAASRRPASGNSVGEQAASVSATAARTLHRGVEIIEARDPSHAAERAPASNAHPLRVGRSVGGEGAMKARSAREPRGYTGIARRGQPRGTPWSEWTGVRGGTRGAPERERVSGRSRCRRRSSSTHRRPRRRSWWLRGEP
jgi:hypothetical protein